MQTADCSIRPLRADDLPAALELQSQAYPRFLLEDADAFASRLALPASFCLAAVRGKTMVAYLLAHGWSRQSPPPLGAVLTPPSHAEVLFIHDLAVARSARGTGIGARLVARATELAASAGLTQAELIAVNGAAGYWRSLGFGEEPLAPALAAKVAQYGEGAQWMVRRDGRDSPS